MHDVNRTSSGLRDAIADADQATVTLGVAVPDLGVGYRTSARRFTKRRRLAAA